MCRNRFHGVILQTETILARHPPYGRVVRVDYGQGPHGRHDNRFRSSVLIATWARLCGAASRDHHHSGSYTAGDIPTVIGLPQRAHRVPDFVSGILGWSVLDRR